MAYASVVELRDYLGQAPAGSDTDVVLDLILERVSAYIDLELDGPLPPATVGTRIVYGDGTTILRLPAFVAGTVTGVTSISSVTVPASVEDSGVLRVVDSRGIQPTYPRCANRFAWMTGYECDVTNGHVVLFGGAAAAAYWRYGVPYTVAATFGYDLSNGGTVQKALTEAALEIAASIWKEKDAGFSTVIGVEGAGAVNIRNAMPLKAKAIIDALKPKVAKPVGVGVY